MKKVLPFILGMVVCVAILVAGFVFFILKVSKAPYKIDEVKIAREYLADLKQAGEFKVLADNKDSEEDEGMYALFLSRNGEELAEGDLPSQIIFSTDDSVFENIKKNVTGDSEQCPNNSFGHANSIEYVRANCGEFQVYLYRVDENNFLGFQIFGNTDDLKAILKDFE